MRVRKPGKALEKAARAIRDSDEFLGHIASISERYRREHALDAGPRGSAVRQSLRSFHKHAAALTLWLEQADKTTSPERDALDKIGVALHGSPIHAHTAARGTLEWLAPATKAAARADADAKLLSRKPQRNAPRLAAEGLRATFEHHRLKLSTAGSKEKPGDAVRLLCAIAKNAGDDTLTADEARKFLRASGSGSGISGNQG